MNTILQRDGAIGRFAFQLWSQRWPTLDPAPASIEQALEAVVRPWRDHTVQLWPHRNDQLVWHPRFDLVDDSLKSLFDRFGGDTIF